MEQLKWQRSFNRSRSAQFNVVLTAHQHNIVVTDKRNRRDGGFIERIGFYNPIATEKEEGLRIAQDRLTYWVGVGAQTSPTVERLIKQAAKKAA